MSHVVRLISVLVLAGASLFCPPAFAIDSGDVVVVSSKGEVHITMAGAERKVNAGGVLELPATVRTGRDGNVELRQGATTVSIGPETLLEFPALEKRGAPIDRILQPRGNAFYDIGKREGRKLRVETPYLVGVIKGTQFNVAALDGATTISLFEGLLEVRATDDSDVIDLRAGEVASRKQGDKTISVIKMDAGKAPRDSSVGATGPAASNPVAPSPVGEFVPDERGPAIARPDIDLETGVRTGVNVSVPDTIDTATNVVVTAAGPAVETGVDTSVSLGGTELSANAAVDAGPAGADVSTQVGVDTGPLAADLGVTAVVDVAAGTVDIATPVSVDAGPVAVDLGTSSGIDLAAGTADTSMSASVDTGALTTDVATDVAVDLSAGTVETGVLVGASAPLVEVDLGTEVAVDTVAGTINLGVDVGGTGIDLGVDITDPVGTVETVTNTVTDTVVDVGGLLNSLVRRPGRK